ncbi:MAG: 16S rRNA (cytidine(1402)-2'-O)-methyltransferase [Actinomycetota bacterium]
MTGRLVLCATPIGNLEDVSLRLLRTLAEADIVACEDPRRTKKLLTHHGVSVRSLLVYNDGNERTRAPELVERIRSGLTVALVSDAGMPGLSDPGYQLVRGCAEAHLAIEVVPGPSSIVSALALSGLPPARFVFEGFLPRKVGERRRRIEELGSEKRTLVFFVPPHRAQATVEDLLEGLGDRPAALARELTKLHEEVIRGRLGELLERLRATPARGELVLVLGGAVGEHRAEPQPEELAARARALMEGGTERKEALTRVAKELGVRRRKVFDALLDPP